MLQGHRKILFCLHTQRQYLLLATGSWCMGQHSSQLPSLILTNITLDKTRRVL